MSVQTLIAIQQIAGEIFLSAEMVTKHVITYVGRHFSKICLLSVEYVSIVQCTQSMYHITFKCEIQSMIKNSYSS